MFYDLVDDKSPHWPWPKGAPETMTPAEVEAVTNVLAVVNAAHAETNDIDDDIIASGWLERIAPVARAALDLMLIRGCFDEEREENEPSNKTLEAAFRGDIR